MWATKRRTKQAKAVHSKRIIYIWSVATVLLLAAGLGIYTFFLFFVPPPLLRPIPAQTEAAEISPGDQTMLTIRKKLAEIGISQAEVKKMPDGNYEVTIPDSGYIILSQSRNLSVQIASLQVILQRLTMEGKRFAKLDMCFDKPVITTN